MYCARFSAYPLWIALLAALVNLLVAPVKSSAQVGGISGSKLSVPEASTVQSGAFEFEPSFSVFQARSMYSRDGSTSSLHGEDMSSNALIRLTAGIADNLEIGTSFSMRMDQVLLGAKYVPIDMRNFHLAVMAGTTIPSGNGFVPDSLSGERAASSWTAGTIVSVGVADRSTADFSFAYSRQEAPVPYENTLSFATGIGDWVSDKLQLVLELNSDACFDRNLLSDKLSVLPGFTFKFSKALLVVVGAQIDLMGMNEEEGVGYFSAFTMSFE